MAGTERHIGPELPPHLNLREKSPIAEEDGSVTPSIIGPVLPPQLRPDVGGGERIEKGETSCSSQKKQSLPEVIGPVLPPHLRHLAAGPSQKRSGSEDSGSSSDSSDGSSDSECIGPKVELKGGDYDVRKEFEDRQRRSEKHEEKEPIRESWMTELPRDRTGVRISGVEARTFLKRSGEDAALDDGWTDTPGQEKRPAGNDNERVEKEQLLRAQRKRDAEIDEQLKEYNASKRSKALIDLHQEGKKSGHKKSSHKKKERDEKQKKRREKEKEKKKKKKRVKEKKEKLRKKSSGDRDEHEGAKSVRKPFNWEEDMRVSMVDTTRAKSMLDRTLLQSRFASGKAQKYL